MGAHNLEAIIKASNDDKLKKKFRQLQDACRIEYGSDPYNGSWSTIPSVRIVSDPFPERKWTKKKEREVGEHLLDGAKKWEYALAVKMTFNRYLVAGWAVS